MQVTLGAGPSLQKPRPAGWKWQATVLDEIMATPDRRHSFRHLGSAKCVAVGADLLKGGFIVGGAHGRGMATCRTATGWSAPAPLTTTGGSVGLQIGGQAVDLVMVVMNDRGMQALLTNKFKLGADASVAAGPSAGTLKAQPTGNFVRKCFIFAGARPVCRHKFQRRRDQAGRRRYRRTLRPIRWISRAFLRDRFNRRNRQKNFLPQ